MIRLAQESRERNVSFITFTRASRRDAEKKLRKVLGEKALDMGQQSLPRITTLHRFAKWLVHRYATATGRDEGFTVLAPRQGEKDIVISEVVQDVGETLQLEALEGAIRQFRSTGKWPDEPKLNVSQQRQVTEAFESLLSFYNTFDMEGLIVAACEILSKRPGDLPPIFLQVDEYQDLNASDQGLLRLASAAPSSQVVVVGDDAQSIYGALRHARPDGIRELWASQDWENQPLAKSHRLPPHILRAAHSLIRDRGYLGGQVDLPDDDGSKVLTLQCTRRTRGTKPPIQVEAVARCIHSLVGTPRKEDGSPTSFGDMMVLCPTTPQVDQAAVGLEETYGVPTRRRQSGEIPQEVWKLLLVLRMVGARDSLALRQWLEVAGVSPTQLRQMRREAMDTGQSLYEYCESVADSRITNVFVSLTCVRQALTDAIEFRQALAAFPRLPLTADVTTAIDEMVTGSFPAVGRMIGYAYEKYGLTDAEQEAEDVAEEDRVLVSTMHGAKGLEAEFVFIMWLNRTFMPLARRDRDEEERVLYVALTRARQDVILTFEEGWDAESGRYLRDEAMSPFLSSIRDHLHIQPVTATKVSGICAQDHRDRTGLPP